MDNTVLTEKISKCLCGDYQSIWTGFLDSFIINMHYTDKSSSVMFNLKDWTKSLPYEDVLLWYTENYVIEQDRKRVLEQASSEKVREILASCTSYTVEYYRTIGEERNYNQMHFLRTDDDSDDFFLIGFRDIDAIKRAERDPLTNVYTRKYFFEKAQNIVNSHPDIQFDIMISDIVDFKEINEIYGSSIGDDILKWSGNFLSSAMTKDVVVGRYSGDQFVIICSHENMELITLPGNSEAFINSMRENGLPKINVKYGIYENIRPDMTIMSVCDKAHIALNSIKHQYGIVSAKYDDNLKKKINTNRIIENSMHQALEEGQFQVYYQPKHDAKTGKLVGAEALIRWFHPVYGLMRPDKFIEIFEKNGFITEVDYFVWKRTCENIQIWTQKGIDPVPISVNESKRTFEQENLVEKLKKCAEDYNVAPDKLHIEITETMTIYDQEDLLKKLNQIRSIGCKVELDDFGSGFSSINMLNTLPLDIVKLDRSFMKQFGNPGRAKVLSACIKLVRELGYKSISEGVEHQEQYDVLKNLGVDAIQGYLFSKPLPEEEFEQYMREKL